MGQENQKKMRTAGERIFIIAIALLAIEVLVFVGGKAYSIHQQLKINNQTKQLDAKEADLKKEESAVEYDRFLAIKDLEEKDSGMTWLRHINKILSMFKDLRELELSSNDRITLSDFYVSLEEISLKGTISSLKTLYYNSESGTFKALLDRFEDLGFIKDMRIKTYEKVGSRNFEFILNANVVGNEQ